MEEKHKGSFKTPFERDAMTQEIIKRDKKFFKLKQNFDLDLKACKL
jgi:hypothetical protein